jgi:hypothetical protein
MTNEKLDELEGLLKAATPGPWWVQAAEDSPKDISHIWRAAPNPATYKGGRSKSWIATVLKSEYHGDVVSVAPEDAALIVAAINALPELVAMAKELDAARAELAEERLRRLRAEARVIELNELRIWAHETLIEINVSNYDHDDVCKLNDASVEVILGLNYFSLAEPAALAKDAP